MPDHDQQPDESKVITELRAEVADLRDHRTRMETRWGIVAGLVGAIGVGVVLGAITTRDAVHDNTARISVVERAQAEASTLARSRESDDRSTREALVALRVTVDELRSQVAELAAALRSAERPPRRPNP